MLLIKEAIMSKLTKCILAAIMIVLIALPVFASGSGEAAKASGPSAVQQIIEQD